MRRIWTQKKEKDRRKVQQTNYQYINTPANNGQDDLLLDPSVGEHLGSAAGSDTRMSNPLIAKSSDLRGQPAGWASNEKVNVSYDQRGGIRMVSALQKQDYDLTTIKNGWLNCIINTQKVGDISDETLRTIRAELKGSHLYLYKPAALLNVKNFRVENDQPANVERETVSPGLLLLDPAVDTSHNDANEIFYKSTDTPHPSLDLKWKSQSQFESDSIEAIVHFLLFESDPEKLTDIERVFEVLPLSQYFELILKYWAKYIEALDANLISGSYNLPSIVQRTILLLKALEENFSGFLLKSDIAPQIIKITEILSYVTHLDDKLTELLLKQKENMLVKQQFLLNLVSPPKYELNTNPIDLSFSEFLKINLLDLIKAISTVDLQFFRHWNSNIDKSLLITYGANSKVDKFYKKNPLYFDSCNHIHYLGRLFINHLFKEKMPTKGALELKARIIERWIVLGCLSDKSGNMSSWLGISSIILSQPVLRLTKVWARVSPEYIRLLKHDWSPVLFELERRNVDSDSSYSRSSIFNGSLTELWPKQTSTEEVAKDSYHIMTPRGLGKIFPKDEVIPYFGDLYINNLSASIDELGSILRRVKYSFNKWNEYLANLSDYNEILQFNSEVIKRYDNEGYVLSNENLNQIFYLGSNTEEIDHTVNQQPSNAENHSSDSTRIGNETLVGCLMKLIDLNCDSLNVDNLMEMSLSLEPELPVYIKQISDAEHNNSYPSIGVQLRNTLAIDSERAKSVQLSNMSDSDFSNATLKNGSSLFDYSQLENEDAVALKIPSFNNNYFKIFTSSYEILFGDLDSKDIKAGELNSFGGPTYGQTFQVDSELSFIQNEPFSDTLGIGSLYNLNLGEGVDKSPDDDDLSGLGIDVDNILNPEKSINGNSNGNVEHKLSSKGTLKENGSAIEHVRNISTSSSIGFGSKKGQYFPKFATLDRLVDLLLIDSRYIDEKIVIDLFEYRYVFLLNYSSFISTKTLLEMLARRFVNSGNAVISIMKFQQDSKKGEVNDTHSMFSWEANASIDLNALGEVDYELLMRIQINILKVLIILLNDFYYNFNVTLENKKTLIELLRLYRNEILQWHESNKIDSKLEKSFASLITNYKKLKKHFVKKVYRPPETSKFDSFLIYEFKFTNSLREIPVNRNLPGHKNIPKIEKFLRKFNKLMLAFYKGIKLDDWMKVCQILECHLEKDSVFDFKLQKQNTSERELIISSIFNYFKSALDPKLGRPILKSFPSGIKKLFKLYYRFLAYLLAQVTDLNINDEERLDRMKTLLIMARISSLKSSSDNFEPSNKNHSSHIPSCIETGVLNVIYTPESRSFSNFWTRASQELNNDDRQDFDNVYQMLPNSITVDDLQSQVEFLPCFGWVVENLLEMNKIPNFVNGNINFSKRYLIYRLLKDVAVVKFEGNEVSFHEAREFEFLLKLDEAIVDKEAVLNSRKAFGDPEPIFGLLLKNQRNILVEDNRKKLALTNILLGSTDYATSDVVSLSTEKSLSSAAKRQSFSYKSSSTSRFKLSGLFSKSRPFSIHGASLSDSRIVDAEELPDPDTQVDPRLKPFAIIPLKSKKTFPVFLRPNCFKVDSDASSDNFLFQAVSKNEMRDWLAKLNYANRHWFFSRTLNLKYGNANLTFGLPINLVCSREQSLSPKFLNRIFEDIEREGLNEVGIYRISSSVSDLSNTKALIDKFGTLLPGKAYNVHTLTGVVKHFFRELPDALFSDNVIDELIALESNRTIETDQSELTGAYKKILRDIPPINYYTLKSFLRHLHKVSANHQVNKMTSTNLATVIGPALTEASTMDKLIINFGELNSVFDYLILNYKEILVGNQY